MLFINLEWTNIIVINIQASMVTRYISRETFTKNVPRQKQNCRGKIIFFAVEIFHIKAECAFFGEKFYQIN